VRIEDYGLIGDLQPAALAGAGRGTFPQYYGSKAPDASVLLMAFSHLMLINAARTVSAAAG
jgi:hypothetical protein